MKRDVWRLIAVWVLGLSGAAFAQTSDSIKSIDIRSKWSGFGPTGEFNLRIEQHKGRFRANGKSIDSTLVEKLIRELNSASNVPTLKNLGITESWLESNSASALPDRLRKALPNEQNLFLSAFKDLHLMEVLLPEILRQGWTDDFPRIEVQIVTKDESEIALASERQNIFMIPIVIREKERERISYNADLSRVIAALLPRGSTNRERLNGDELISVIADRVMSRIEGDLNLLETKNKLGPELKVLESRYRLDQTKIGYISSVDVETLGEKFPRWNAVLRRTDLLQNVTIGISLPYQDNRLSTFDWFIRSIDSIVALPLTVPWVSNYLSEHPDVSMEIRFVTDRSVSPKVAAYFVETAKALHAEKLAEQVQRDLDHSVFIEFTEKGGWSRWFVLASRKMILFDFQGSTVLGWNLNDFDTSVRYDTKYWHMAKALIEPNGKIESR